MGGKRTLLDMAILLLAGGLVLAAGLLPSALRTGQIVPLDWLAPGALALIVLIFVADRPGRGLNWRGLGWRGLSWRGLGLRWAIVAGPPALLLALMSSLVPWDGLALLLVTLGLTGLGVRMMHRRAGLARWGIGGALAALLIALPPLADAVPAPVAPASRPVVGVFSALPLHRERPLAVANLLDGMGRRSPLWRALGTRLDLRPLDHVDLRSLAGLDHLLVAQPRLLAPEELVALDHWVRAGGQAVLLADPLLHWPDRLPLGDPARAPLTSLLDPLLAHWGLRLQPAVYEMTGDPVERRLLADGALVQLVGASRFSPARGASCALADGGLIARCDIGKGMARLMADADWINDRYWTLRPGRPTDARDWTSDTVPLLLRWLGADSRELPTPRIWLRDRAALLLGLRAAIALLFALTLIPILAQRFPRLRSDRYGSKGVQS